MGRDDALFAGGHLSDALRAQERKMAEAAQEIPADHALARSTEELSAELVERFRVEPLDLAWDAKTVSHRDTKVDVTHDPRRFIDPSEGPVHLPGTSVTYHVPFQGDADLFKLRPSTMTTVLPHANVTGNELQITVTAPIPVPPTLGGALEEEVKRLEQYVAWANADVARFNFGLEAAARTAAQRRREKVLADHELIASLGVPVRRREDAAPTYAAPAVQRRVSRPARPAGHAARPPEPVLPAEEYENILRIVRGMVSVMERSPKAFARLDEEALRDHFLVQVNGQYQGGATGETFNYQGKTDILVRERDRNLFIAECKFSRGPKGLTETVDQLLGYTSWRDTKTAIFLFNRTRNLSTLLSQIGPTIATHPNCVRAIPYGSETDFRFVLRRSDDPERELTLTVLVFEVPR